MHFKPWRTVRGRLVLSALLVEVVMLAILVGNSMRLLVALEHSPSEGSYVSKAEAVALHILARADHFMRRSDLS